MNLPILLDPSLGGSLDKFKESFLCAAAQGGNTEDCESLLEIGANVEWKNVDGDTPLLSAVRRGHADTAALLLVHGADLNAKGHDGLTPLHVVCRNGDVRTLNVLLNAGASPQVLSDSHLTPVDIARAKGYEDIVKRLSGAVGDGTASTSTNNGGSTSSGALPPVVPPRHDPDAESTRALTPQLLGRVNNNNSSNNNSNTATGASASQSGGGSRQGSRGGVTATNSSASTSSGFTPILNPNASAERSAPGSRSGSRATSNASNPRVISSVSISGDDGSIHVSSSLTSLPTTTSTSFSADFASKSTSAHAPKRTSGYALIGGGGRGVGATATSGVDQDSLHQQQIAAADFLHDDQYIGLCRQLEVENKARKLLESQLIVARRQTLELEEALVSSKQEVSELEASLASQRAELDRYRAAGVETYTMSECEDLERRLKATLDAVAKRKEQIVQEELGSKKEQRLCVVCLANEKSVVLFPCRHMCVCEDCAGHDDLDTCPLCRRVIVQRVSVFS